MAKTVSVIIPCYNTAKYIHRLLDSILHQTYTSMEIVAIDDGSTDNTADVIKSYISKFAEKGISLKYFYQTNSGQSVAIQNALDLINGEYLVWPDSDDYYASNEAISIMVGRLEKSSDDIAMVRTQEIVVKDDENHTPINVRGLGANEIEPRSLFEDCLFDKNGYYYTPGAYMIKIKALKNATKLPIYTSKDAGQNWQLMLPILYHYKCATILQPLYCVIQRADSHSRGQYDGNGENYLRLSAYCNTIIATIDNIIGMPNEERDVYKKAIYKKYDKSLLRYALYACDKSNCMKHYERMQNNQQYIPIKFRFSIVLLKLGILSFVLKIKDFIKV